MDGAEEAIVAEQVWVRLHGEESLVPGLVLKWQRRKGQLRALVTCEVEGRLITDWVRPEALVPDDDERPAGATSD